MLLPMDKVRDKVTGEMLVVNGANYICPVQGQKVTICQRDGTFPASQFELVHRCEFEEDDSGLLICECGNTRHTVKSALDQIRNGRH